MTLLEYIEAEAEKPFALGAADCAHFVAKWVRLRTGRDGLALFSGLDHETARLLVENGRLLRAMVDGCESIGLTRTGAPIEGDIGVIRTAHHHRCAIRGARGWLYRGETGIGSATDQACTVLAAWEVR